MGTLMNIALLCLLGVLADSGKPYPRPELLLEATDLKKQPERFRVLDARTRAAYQAAHIPGAVWVSHLEWGQQFNRSVDAKTWSDRLGKLGLDAETPVVVYGDAISPDAALVWWILRYWGLRDVRLLNGGWHAWQKAGGPVSKEQPAVQPKTPTLSAHPECLATKDQLVDWLKSGQKQLVDTRSSKEYRGDTITAERNGAIPGAKHLEWSDLVDRETQKLKPAEELARLFQEHGISTDRPAVTYCQSGRRAAVMAFALELMGGKEVRNYVKSWSEWGNDPATPIEKPTTK